MTPNDSTNNTTFQSLLSENGLESRSSVAEIQGVHDLPNADTPAVGPLRDNEQELNEALSLNQISSDPPWGRRTDHALRLQSRECSPSASARSSLVEPLRENQDEPRHVIISSFAPRIACLASADTEQFMNTKGFNDGLCGLLRPFGERIQGKVVIRDSVGASRGWEDFGVRFVNTGPTEPSHSLHEIDETNGTIIEPTLQPYPNEDPMPTIDKVLEFYLSPECELQQGTRKSKLGLEYGSDSGSDRSHQKHSSAYLLYLRKLLSSMPVVPYETFAHPVACVIAVSARNSSPIDSLRQLYESSSQRAREFYSWTNTEYLRYYVLVHDEENDDITKSTALFDLMKRHFGLHCHLLRLRGSHCAQTDDDSVRVPVCEWLSAEEELALFQRQDRLHDVGTIERYVHESDANAIRNFIREMVIQSVIPFMEGRVTAWNDQVASKRRGISGRFMSLSKRFVGLGVNKPVKSKSSDINGSFNDTYDASRGVYSHDSTESTMRQLADHAFMLRDWKLAYNIYEILRMDFGNDKAWKYHAAANEMAAISLLLMPQSMANRARSEFLGQMLETASYSYFTRCSLSFGAVRCLTIAIELLKSRPSISTEEAAKWGARLLELCVLSPIGQGFLSERIAECYRSRLGVGLPNVGSRKRQTAFWYLLASATWIRRGDISHAHDLLRLARALYENLGPQEIRLPFPSMSYLWERLENPIILSENKMVNSENETLNVQSLNQHSDILTNGDYSHPDLI